MSDEQPWDPTPHDRGVLPHAPIGEPVADRLGKLRAIVGDDRLLAALDTGIEAAKCGIAAEQIVGLMQSQAFLALAGITPRPGQGFDAWSREHGIPRAEAGSEPTPPRFDAGQLRALADGLEALARDGEQ